MTHVVFSLRAMCGAGSLGDFEGDAVSLMSPQFKTLEAMVTCKRCLELARSLKLYQIAQDVTDQTCGAGAYVRLNRFDPSTGQTRHFDFVTGTKRVQSDVSDARSCSEINKLD